MHLPRSFVAGNGLYEASTAVLTLTELTACLLLLAATLEHSPGTVVETFVTFLTAAQLKRMHETEGAYFLNELTQLDLHVGLSLEAFR